MGVIAASAQSLRTRGDDQLGASEKQCWPGAHRHLAEEEVPPQSEEMLVVRHLCPSRSFTERQCPRQMPQVILPERLPVPRGLTLQPPPAPPASQTAQVGL